ncbi:unnamed protein product [Rhizoctonia solani]|uniref:F-box domain-containing protein n=1 Tax=Rhizoctonia solani TaxID=456999 RepID=A0A8H3I0B3_9AGAM|nr:unnamed protein product [Rhizoctonia solani]
MIEELNNARSLLKSALDRYLTACLCIRKNCLENASFANVSPGLLPHIESEEHFVTEFETKLQRAKAAIRTSRNCSTLLVPIHKLPSEILERIFLLLATPQPGPDRSSPEVLSHVCSRWRKTVLGYPLLWSFIDSPFTIWANTSHPTRFASLVSRAYPLPLNVRLGPDKHALITAEYGKIPINVNTPINSLEVAYTTDRDFLKCYQRSVLAACFARCKPGTLKSLTMFHRDTTSIFLDVAPDWPRYLDREKILTAGNLDQILASLKILRVKGFYPAWTSKAYHGLVELRLANKRRFTSEDRPPISENHLRGILTASPALRILELCVQIIEALPQDTSIAPIRLSELESLNVVGILPDQANTFFRLLAPGSKPLQLAVNMSKGLIFLRELQDYKANAFFAHSNITALYARYLSNQTLPHLLDLCPHLKTLVWDRPIPAQAINNPSSSSLRVLETLVVSRKDGIKDAWFIDSIAKISLIQNLLFWECNSNSYKRIHVDDLEGMSTFCSHIEILDNNPTRDWDIFVDIPGMIDD